MLTLHAFSKFEGAGRAAHRCHEPHLAQQAQPARKRKVRVERTPLISLLPAGQLLLHHRLGQEALEANREVRVPEERGVGLHGCEIYVNVALKLRGVSAERGDLHNRRGERAGGLPGQVREICTSS